MAWFWPFFYGIFTGIAAVFAAFALVGRATRPFLAARLAAFELERKTTLAKAVKAAASVDAFKVSSIGAVKILSTPAHIQTSGAQFRLTMMGPVITVTAVAAAPPPSGAAASSQAVQNAAAKVLTQDKVIATLSAKNVTAKLDRKDRTVLHLTPVDGADFLCEVTDRDPNGTEDRHVKWRALSLTFTGGPREAERWHTILSPTPATQRWINFVKSIPTGSDTSLNFLVARILFDNSGDTTLDEFIAAKVRKKLAHIKLPKPLSGAITLADLRFGDEAPFFTNSAMSGTAATGEFAFDFDLLYRGGFTLVLSVTIDVGPIKIPNVLVTVRILELKGRVHFSVGAPPSNKMWIGFHEAPQLKLDFHQDIHLPPELNFLSAAVRSIDLSEVVSAVVKESLFEDMVLPYMDDLPIPNVGPTPPSTPTTADLVLAKAAFDPATQVSDWDVLPSQQKPQKQEPILPPAAKQAPVPSSAAAEKQPQKPQPDVVKAPQQQPVKTDPATPPQAPAQPMLLSKSPARPPSDTINRIIKESEGGRQQDTLSVRGAAAGATPVVPPMQPLPPPSQAPTSVEADADAPEVKAAAVAKAAQEAKRKADEIVQQSKAKAAATQQQQPSAPSATAATPPPQQQQPVAAAAKPTPPHSPSPQDDTWDYASDAEQQPPVHQRTSTLPPPSPAAVSQPVAPSQALLKPIATLPTPQPQTVPVVTAATPGVAQPAGAAAAPGAAAVVDTSMYGRRYVQSQPQW